MTIFSLLKTLAIRNLYDKERRPSFGTWKTPSFPDRTERRAYDGPLPNWLLA